MSIHSKPGLSDDHTSGGSPHAFASSASAASLYETRHISPGDKMTVMNASLTASNRQEMSFDVVAGTAGRFGVGFLVPFLSGRRSEIEIKMMTGSARLLRMEVTGYATRMQKAYFEFEADGHLVRAAEEITSVTITREPEGILRINAAFVPHRSRQDWLYLFAWPGDSANADCPCTFSASALAYRIDSESREQSHVINHIKVFENGGMFKVHALQTFRNYLHIEFEIHKHDARLSGLRLITPEAIESAQWWTLDVLGASGSRNDVQEGYALTPQKAVHAIPSPMLLETLGEHHGWRGHRVTALYKQDRDVRYINPDECDVHMQKLKLAASFEDGTMIILSCVEGSSGLYDFTDDMSKIERYRIPPENRLPVFVEVGARGPSSIRVRRMIQGSYQYVGVDLLPDKNVDLVGDAHLLSEFVGLKTADVVFTHSVMEHLIAPIKFVLEANKILRPGGLFIAHAPTCFPLHAEPWDFWRFSSHAWAGLLNGMTGFEILEVLEYGDAAVVPTISADGGCSSMQGAPAPLFTCVIARKISDSRCEYSIWSADLAQGRYD